MRVDDGVHVRSLTINGEVHLDLARDGARAREPLTVQVDDDHLFGLHHALAHAARRGQHATFVQADREVAVASRDETLLVNALAELDQVTSQMLFGSLNTVGHGHRILSRLPEDFAR